MSDLILYYLQGLFFFGSMSRVTTVASIPVTLGFILGLGLPESRSPSLRLDKEATL